MSNPVVKKAIVNLVQFQIKQALAMRNEKNIMEKVTQIKIDLEDLIQNPKL